MLSPLAREAGEGQGVRAAETVLRVPTPLTPSPSPAGAGEGNYIFNLRNYSRKPKACAR
jgi:hypothetical protein